MEHLNASLIQTAEQRASRYWFADGLSTLVTGAAMLLIGLFLGSHNHQPKPVYVVLELGVIGLYLVLMIGQRPIVDWLKERITYPRTGYVRPPDCAEGYAAPPELPSLFAPRDEASARSRTDATIRLVCAAAIVLLACATLMLTHNRWFFAAGGCLMSAAFWLFDRQHRQLTWIAFAGFPLFGLYMTAFRPNLATSPDRLDYFLAAGGALFLLDGAVALVRYVVQNPVAKVPAR